MTILRHHAPSHSPPHFYLNPNALIGLRTCPLGGQSGDFGWFGLQSLITLLNLSAIVTNIFFIFICGKAGVMPRQTRLMLCSISICFAVNAFAGLLYNAYFFYLGVNTFPRFPEKSVLCTVANVLMVPWDTATVLLMIGVGAERFAATRHPLPPAKVSLFVKAIFALACSASGFVTVEYLLNLHTEGMCVCDGASLADSHAMMIRISVCALFEAATISLFGYVMVYSRSRADGLGINTAKYSLSKRFQIHETFRTTQMLLPSVVLHAVLYLSYLLLLFPVRDWRASSINTISAYNYSTIIFAFPSMHALAHPLICILQHYYLRQRTLDIFDQLWCCSRIFTDRSNDDCRHLQPTPDPPSIRERETPGRVEFRIAPEKHAEILESFWDRK
ncbi:unnamed protein product, partial [Mesorhabditis belari]|uniref:G-protein coupled receptors family 1 profile domain-containing protein n=1 Tax=Mesorhabditis belari TaxID=2138241 RepID=A0AAF3F5H5_9BILA